MPWIRVAASDDVVEGRTYRTDAAGRPILLARVVGRFSAIDAA